MTCGVARPLGYSPTSSSTTAVNGVRWFQQIGSDAVVWTAVRPDLDGRGQIYLALTVPKKYDAAEGYLVDLAAPIKEALPTHASG